MRSVPWAMTWELLACGRWPMTFGFLGGLLFPVLLLTALRMDGAIDPEMPAFITIHLVVVLLENMCFASAILHVQQSSNRHYVLPISTATLVTWRMVPAMVLATLNTLAALSLLNWVFSLEWPVWGPALFAAACIAVFQASLWYAERSPWQAYCLVVPLVAVAIWFKSRYGYPFSLPTHLWNEVRLSDTATMAAIVVLSFLVAIPGVARNRCGAMLGGEWAKSIEQFVMQLMSVLPTSPLSQFADRKQAQFWVEWQLKGWVMPTIVVTGIIVALAGWTIESRQARSLIEGMTAGGVILSLLGIIGGLIIGNFGRTDTSLEMGQFLGTRPMTNVELASTVLKVAMRSVFYSWCLWLTAFAVIASIMLACGNLVAPLIPKEVYWWYLPATLLGGWVATASLTCVTLTGRGPLMARIAACVITVAIVLPLVSKTLDPEARDWFGAVAFVLLGITIMIGTAWIMYLAHRQAMISSRGTLIAGLAWIILSVVAVSESLQHATRSFAGSTMLVAMASLVVVPFAAAPLAVAWNRHR